MKIIGLIKSISKNTERKEIIVMLPGGSTKAIRFWDDTWTKQKILDRISSVTGVPVSEIQWSKHIQVM